MGNPPPPDEWTIEDEEMIPPELQDWSWFNDEQEEVNETASYVHMNSVSGGAIKGIGTVIGDIGVDVEDMDDSDEFDASSRRARRYHRRLHHKKLRKLFPEDK